jgi:hypothetical protein
MSDDQNGLEVFEAFPEIAELGESRINELCQAFLQTPVAKEFAVSALRAFENNGSLLMTFSVDLPHAIRDGENYFFPIDQLLRYIADQGVDPEKRSRLKDRISNIRKHYPNVFRRFKINPGPKLPLFLSCKNALCGCVMMTQFRAYRSERGQWGPSSVECPRCHSLYEYDQNDLHFEPSESDL